MSEHDRDDEVLDRLRDELREDREPPASGIAMVRMQAQARRDARTRPATGRRRRDLLLGGATAAAGAALGVAGYAIADDDPAAPPTEAIALTAAPGVRASGELINHTWGVELLLTVGGLEAGRTYDVVYRSAADEDVPAGSFLAVEGELLCRMTAALLRSDTRAIEVRDAGGTAVVRSRLS